MNGGVESVIDGVEPDPLPRTAGWGLWVGRGLKPNTLLWAADCLLAVTLLAEAACAWLATYWMTVFQSPQIEHIRSENKTKHTGKFSCWQLATGGAISLSGMPSGMSMHVWECLRGNFMRSGWISFSTASFCALVPPLLWVECWGQEFSVISQMNACLSMMKRKEKLSFFCYCPYAWRDFAIFYATSDHKHLCKH